jgi:riboflavin synthase
MFTGIIEELGTIESAIRQQDVLRVAVKAPLTAAGLATGGSVAVNGCCLTAVAVASSGFSCELTEETLVRTAFESRLRPGRRVNLERPLRADGRFEGHLVQGHVDGLGRVSALQRDDRSAELVVETPPELARYVVEKGSVAVDGISLTIARLRPEAFTAAIIPYTLEHTNLCEVRIGDAVNLEVDIVGKYVERLLSVTGASGR